MSAFHPLRDYTGFNHVPTAGAVWFHPKNGTAYCCACEKDSGKRQDLSVYRRPRGATAWELVKRYDGSSSDSASQITMGGAGIDQDGNLLVVTSLTIPNVPKVTFEGFQGVSIDEPNIDEPWSGGEVGPQGEQGEPGKDGNDPRYDSLVSQLGALGQQLAQLQAGGGVTLLPAPRTVAAWEGRVLNGGVDVDVPAVFGVPSASAYLIRFVASATKADVRVRAGTAAAPHFLTMNLVVPNLQSHIQGWAPGPIVYVSTAQGEARVWLQVLGIGA